ncbi:MAG: ribonuclease P protein component [Patescibacteria group bacterium]
MLSKSERLTKKQVEAVLASGRRHSSAYFFATVLAAPVESASIPTFAIVVSKKTADTAVERNKLRRRTYSAIRQVKKIISARPNGKVLPFYVVVVVKREAKPAKLPDLIDDLGRLMKISGVI